MTTRAHLQRQLALIRRLQQLKRPCSFAELQAYLLEQTTLRDVTSSYSKRTFERDVQAIAEVFGISIYYDARQRGYAIDHSEPLLSGQDRLLDAMELHAFLQLPAALAPYVQLEPRRPLGLEFLRPLLGALQAKQLVAFSYCKFWEDQPTRRVIGPLLLKEFRGRWYMVGVKANTKQLRCFGLDRISDLSVSNQLCTQPADFAAGTYYEHAFGITRPDEGEPQDIVLSLTPTQGRYVQSFPLHSSQQLISQTVTETRIGLRVFDTHDLRMELLSMGEEVKVLAPAELRAWLHNSYAAASSLY
ncbi:helix-turn-helix transcriptional regulator [Hymenobacter arizonensis]|uniref:Predicted DNA-binding transcriptional regulator YafY, contains an HTH and WYL domains n=1 Tax=Hymenobacter arizonensis TaxID=1227077 RepID=A0A1I5YXP3_HYMAR|nr:WYL domain-containing protein [Hymenobacter arizonensis]SFQ48890.1 Predicted DNA-binding transcriptional regulator YafY, contains an HTH and WYL domains [Hymenobacter arizonensis]